MQLLKHSRVVALYSTSNAPNDFQHILIWDSGLVNPIKYMFVIYVVYTRIMLDYQYSETRWLYLG